MSKIDIKEWKEFRIGDLFDICSPTFDLQAPKLSDGNLPLISSGKTTNGICKRVARSEVKEIYPCNSITVDMFGKAFFHPYQYCAVSHGRVNILCHKGTELNHCVGLFFVGSIDVALKGKYSFKHMCSKAAIQNETILLPTAPDGFPDYQYMEDYMKEIENTVSSNLKIFTTLLQYLPSN